MGCLMGSISKQTKNIRFYVGLSSYNALEMTARCFSEINKNELCVDSTEMDKIHKKFSHKNMINIATMNVNLFRLK